MAAQPPSAQEVQRKLSLCAPPKQTAHIHAGRDRNLVSLKPDHNNNVTHAGAESDSDSPAQLVPSPSSPAKPLFSIAERRNPALSGDESEEEDDEDEGEGGWRTADVQRGLRGSADETIIKTGYLWKKGERRKVGFL